jgi:hypothetical protein
MRFRSIFNKAPTVVATITFFSFPNGISNKKAIELLNEITKIRGDKIIIVITDGE